MKGMKTSMHCLMWWLNTGIFRLVSETAIISERNWARISKEFIINECRSVLRIFEIQKCQNKKNKKKKKKKKKCRKKRLALVWFYHTKISFFCLVFKMVSYNVIASSMHEIFLDLIESYFSMSSPHMGSKFSLKCPPCWYRPRGQVLKSWLKRNVDILFTTSLAKFHLMILKEVLLRSIYWWT